MRAQRDAARLSGPLAVPLAFSPSVRGHRHGGGRERGSSQGLPIADRDLGPSVSPGACPAGIWLSGGADRGGDPRRRLSGLVSGRGSGLRAGSTGRSTQGRTRARPAARGRRRSWPPNGRPRSSPLACFALDSTPAFTRKTPTSTNTTARATQPTAPSALVTMAYRHDRPAHCLDLRPWHQPASFDVLTHNVRPHVAKNLVDLRAPARTGPAEISRAESAGRMLQAGVQRCAVADLA